MKIVVTMPLSEAQKKRIDESAPGMEYCYCLPNDITEEVAADAEVILGNVPVDKLPWCRQLKWLQLNSAGTEGYCSGALPQQAQLTNATGAYGLAISEYMIGVLFELRKKLNLYHENQMLRQWKRMGHVGVVEGTTVLVIGLGDIGTTFARKMHALGCYTIGFKRRESRCPEGVDELHLMNELEEYLPKADVVALSVPGNEQTRHILNRERIALLNENAIVLNVGRGTAVDTEALLEALQEGRISGAGLDVTDPEPLPEEHPLWTLDNVIITPHVSGGFTLPETLERIVGICADNLRRYMNGEELKNQVDLQTGYCK